MTDAATYIGLQVKSILELIVDIDRESPDEDIVEVLIGSVNVWGILEAQLLYPALEAAFEDSEETIEPALKRLNALQKLQDMIHENEYSEDPWSVLATKYVDAVKYHLLVDVQDIAPLAAQLPARISQELVASMSAMKEDLV